MPQMYWIIPVEGGGGRPDNTLPGGQGGHPSQPIYHPGHPDHGLPPFPSQGLPGGGQGGRPEPSDPHSRRSGSGIAGRPADSGQRVAASRRAASVRG